MFGGGAFLRDSGPIYAVSHQYTNWWGSYSTWTATTKYGLSENLVKNGFLQAVTTGGTSGNSEPSWNATPTGTTSDGSIVWTNQGSINTQGTIHAWAKVVDGGPVIPQIASLSFIQQPTNTVSGVTITPAVTVRLLDQSGNPYTLLPAEVILYICGAGTLTGGNPAVIDPVTGIATFSGLSIAQVGSGYVLRARVIGSINLIPADSNSFNIT